MNTRRSFYQWLRATWLGWLLGVPAIVVLALIGEALGIGGVQVLVGAGMGAGIGFMQARALRGVLPRVAPWFWSCALGLALPFLFADIAKAMQWNYAYSLYLSVACGGLIVGIWQGILLRSRFRNAALWVAGSMVGWSFAASIAMLSESLTRTHALRGIFGALAYLGVIAAGGLILGLVTGVAFACLRPREVAA